MLYLILSCYHDKYYNNEHRKNCRKEKISLRVDIEFISYQERWNQYEGLLRELLAYQSKKIDLFLNGKQSTPYEITHACMTAEKGEYMRDYVGDDNGKLIQISFDKIRE